MSQRCYHMDGSEVGVSATRAVVTMLYSWRGVAVILWK